MAHPYQELRVSNDAVGDAEELRRRMADEGYLFIKGLQDADKLWSLRRIMRRDPSSEYAEAARVVLGVE
jgi:hypothetical protein